MPQFDINGPHFMMLKLPIIINLNIIHRFVRYIKKYDTSKSWLFHFF